MSERGLVVVTGVSTGIGRATSERLARGGFRVLGTVRREADGEAAAAAAPDRIQPLVVDVTEADAPARIADAVRMSGDRLEGLVNNAGITVPGPVELLDPDDWRRQFEVNLFAPALLIRALLPALRDGQGRVVNISSIGGRTVAPYIGAYSSSKFALEAMSDALRREVSRQGVGVVVVEPGSTATEIWDKGDDQAREAIADLTDEQRRVYGAQLEAMLRLTKKTADRGIPAEKVAKVIEKALTARRPRTRYLVGGAAKVQATLNTVLGDRGYDRLVARMLGA